MSEWALVPVRVFNTLDISLCFLPFRSVMDAAVAHYGSRSLGGAYLQGPAGMHTVPAWNATTGCCAKTCCTHRGLEISHRFSFFPTNLPLPHDAYT